MSGDPAYLSVAELGHAYRHGRLSPTGVTEALLARIARLDPSLSAFVTVTAETARAQARRAEQELRAGHDRGPLHGVPHGLKDVIDTEGIRTTRGARPFKDRVPERDAAVVERLHAAGSVLAGKLACIELAAALGCSSAGATFTGPTRNPWDRTRWAGGSSSGAGAAVAAGLVPFALATETLGSILCPAAFCGVVGLRPSFGAVSRRGVMPFSYTMDKVGVLARSCADAALALAAVAGRDPADSTTAAAPAHLRLALDPARIRGARIAAVEQDLGYPLDPNIEIFFQQVVSVLERLGAKVVPARMPDLPYSDIAFVVATAEAVDAFDDLVSTNRVRELDDPRHRAETDYYGPARAADYVRAMRLRTRLADDLRRFFQQHDAAVTLNSAIAPPLVDRPLPLAGGDVMRFAGNLVGLPAVAVPMGFLTGRLPVGFQIVGKPGDEARILSYAAAYEGVTEWHRARPPI